MAQDLEQQPAAPFSPEQVLSVMRRRPWHILVPLFLGWALVWGASWVLPSIYKSETTILVEQPTVPKDYVTPNVNDNLQDRLRSITQQILSRTRLLHIIDQLDLYAAQRGKTSPDDLVGTMRKDIGIELIHAPGTDQLTSFNVSFSSRDPKVAQQVTSELTNLFIRENLEARQGQSEGTTKFLESQLEEARKSLTDQEEKIRTYKDRHVGDLPGQLQSNLQILSGLQSQLQSEEDHLNSAKQQNVYFQSLLNQYHSLQRSAKATDGTAVGLPALDAQLTRLRAQLADMSSRYTDRHPDVRKLKEQIAQTEATKQKLLAAAKAGPSTNDAAADDSSDIDSAPTAQLRSQLRANQIEITNRERSISGLQARIGEYQGRLNQEPVREQELADLSRGYEQSKENYDELLKKKNASGMATSLELLQQGEHFRVLDPPSLPLRPNFPKRLPMSGIGFALGLVLAGLVTIGAEMTDEKLHSEKAIKELLPVDVIAEIPTIASPEEQSKAHRNRRMEFTAASFVVISILAGTAVSFLRG